MDAYIETLLGSEMLVSPWLVAVSWVATFVATHLLIRSARAALARQQLIVVPQDDRLTRGTEPKYIAGQVLLAVAIFAIALYFGGAFFAFFAGGFVVASTIALGLNYYGLMYARILRAPKSGSGHITVSPSFSFATAGQQMLGGALACLLLGFILGQLAFLGGALFLGSTGFGYLRKAA